MIIILIATFSILFIPGVLLFDLSGIKNNLNRLEKLFLSPFLSLSFIATLIFIYSKLIQPFYLRTFCLFLIAIFSLFLLKRIILKKSVFPGVNSFCVKKRVVVWLNDNKLALLLFPPSIVFLFIQLYGFWGRQLPLSGDDPIIHYFYINKISSSGLLLESNFYPHGMHVFISLVHQATQLPIEQILITSTIMIVCLIPFSLYYLAKVITKNKKIALYTALMTPLFSLFPIRPYLWGAFPFLWGLVFLWQYVGFFIETLQKTTISRIVMAVLLGFGLFFIHSPEFITASIFIGCYLLLNLALLKKVFVWIFLFLQSGAMVFVYEILATRQISNILTTPVAEWQTSFYDRVIQFFSYGVNYFIFLGNIFILIICALGLTLFVKERKKERSSILFYFLAMLLIYVDIIFFQKLRFFYALFYPWGDSFRFMEFVIFPTCFLAGLGFLNLERWIKGRQDIGKTVALYLMTVLGILPLIVGAIFFREGITNSTPNGNFRGSIKWIEENLIPGTMILNNPYYYQMEDQYRPADYAGWIDVLTENRVTFPYLNLLDVHSEIYQERFYILSHLPELNANNETRDLLEKHNIKYVFWQADFQRGREESYLKIEDLLKNENLRLVYQSDPECQNSPREENCIFVFEIKED